MARLNRSHPLHLAIVAVFILSLLGPVTGSQAVAAPQAPASAAANIVDVPVVNTQPTIDGFCDTGKEYNKSLVETFVDGNGQNATVYIFSDSSNLYICMQAQVASFPDVFGRVYLDPQADGNSYLFANQGDDGFRINLSAKPSTVSYIGSGIANGWTENSGLDAGWSGAAAKPVGAQIETYEWSLDLKSLNFGLNCGLFGLSVFHHWFSGTGDDYAWPAGSIFDQPRTWQLMRIPTANCVAPDIAYVYRGNKDDAASFYNLLTANGYAVHLVALTDVLTTDFSVYNLIIIANDTGSLDQWGSSGLTATQVAKIKAPNKPIIGLGEGGYAFFGRMGLFIGWPQGWHGPQNKLNKAATAPAGYFGPGITQITHYTTPFNSVGIYLNPNLNPSWPADVTPIGLEEPLDDHAALIQQGCDFLWGNSGNALIMTSDGQLIFLKTVSAAHGATCPVPGTPSTSCRDITKTSDVTPTPTSPVSTGQLITYTLHYTYSNSTPCSNSGAAKIIDFVPPNTTFVPGSASGGISPGPDGSLEWGVLPTNHAPLSDSLSFQVRVADTACPGPTALSNQARLLAYGYAPLITAALTNTVTCPVLAFPSHSPFYAEDELTVSPYPLSASHVSEVKVRLTNVSAAVVNVTVQFQIGSPYPPELGVGLSYNTFATRTAVIPASSTVELSGYYAATASGSACFQVVAATTAQPQVLVTQSCLDTTEDFSSRAGQDMNFVVGNPAPSTANVTLVVDNTCPGWTASIITPSGGVYNNVLGNDADLRPGKLHVGPVPSPLPLGTGCHIDVQEWIGTTLIGGIRKLDLPPVHLPTNVVPAWEEPEITFIPEPPVLGVPNQVCVQLTNPTAVSKSVTLRFDEADFGAGIGFTPFATHDFLLPPNSTARYCVSYTPASTGTLHRCILVHLIQSGYQDMTSQHNVDLVHPSTSLALLDIPFTIANPDLVDHQVTFDLHTVGILPPWMPIITDGMGGMPPFMLPAGGTLTVHLAFTGGVLTQASPAPLEFRTGDASGVSVGVLLDGAPSSGVTIAFAPHLTYFPIAKK